MSGFAALTWLQLGALLALAFGLLAWLHLRAPRPVRTRVPFLGAWDEVAPARTVRPAKWALVRSWALLRALLFVTLLALALTDPQPAWLVGAPRTTLIVLDAGAHMRALDEAPSRFEKARKLALSRVGATSGDVMVAQLETELTPLSGWERNSERLKAAVRAASVSSGPTRFAALVEFARAQLHGKPSPEVIVFSDGAFEVPAPELRALRDAGIALRQVPVGSSAQNLAIRRFAIRAYLWDAERCEVMLELQNSGDRTRTVELTLFEDGRPIDVRPLQLPANSRTTHFFGLGASGTKFTARIAAEGGSKDVQPLDDEASAVLPQRRARRVLLVTDGQRYLESAIALDPKSDVVKQKPADYRSAAGFDVVVFDRFAPSAPPGVPALWIAAGQGGPLKVTGSVERPFFEEVQADQPLLKALALRDVNLRRAQRVELAPEDRVLARSKQGPLIVQGTRSGQPFVALTFDARESDLVLRTAWPVLLNRALQQLTAAGGAAFAALFGASEHAAGIAEIQPKSFASQPGRPSLVHAIPPRDRPWLALLAVALVLLAIDTWRLSRGRRFALVLRVGSGLCLVVALFRPELQRTAERVHLIVAADVSESVRDAALGSTARQIRALRGELATRNERADARQQGRLDALAFAREARPLPASATTLERFAAGGAAAPGFATDLSAALRRAFASFAPDYVHNLLVVSDGNQTQGDVLEAAALAARLGIRVDVLTPTTTPTPDVAVQALMLPRELAAGVPFTLRAEVSAERPVHVRAELYAATDPPKLETSRELDLPAGTTELTFPLTAKAPGRLEYRLQLQPSAADARPENDAASVAAEVPGPPRVLILDSEPTLAAPLARALRSRDFEIDVKAATAAPRRDEDYADYAFVILSDVSARDMHPEAVAALGRYVREFGGGLLASGGARGFGLGADRTPFDALLPVRAAAEEQRDQASLALALIIDCSGSMAGGKLDLAREAAALTAQTLADPDLIEVIGFSSQPERRVRLQPASNRASIAQSIARLAATGGTQLYPALDAAYRDLRGAQARLKHAILLTDGQTQEAGIEDLASSMRADGITLSTVGLGSEVNRGLLETVAGLGGGRAYFPLDAQTIPQIFMSEASRQKRPSAVDRSTRVFERERAGFLEDIALQTAPALAGYVTTQAKPRPVQVILETDRGEPLLARWRVGLGYALAWTSDLKPRWASSFLRWPSFARFAAQLVREHMRAAELREAPVEARVSGDQLHVIADAVGGGDQFENGRQARLRVLSRAGEVAAAPLDQVGPGRYEARLPWIQTGAFTVEVSFHRAGRREALGRGRFAKAFAGEFEAARPNQALLQQVAERTGGRQLTTATQALDPGVRRVTFREPCWPALAWIALGLFLLEQCVRHARVLGRTPPPNRTGG